MNFFVGLHQPSDARHFDMCLISVHRLNKRKSKFRVRKWILDSGAFSIIAKHGKYIESVEAYAAQIRRWKNNGQLLAAVTQDYMCEPMMLKKTGLTIPDHQRLTIERYDALVACNTGVYIMPVLQGYAPEDYVDHIDMYGDRLAYGAWVGVGSICKRNASPCLVMDVLWAIHIWRPDLQLHGFGLKITALSHGGIQSLLFTADSMSWSAEARWARENANDWRNAMKFKRRIEKSMAA